MKKSLRMAAAAALVVLGIGGVSAASSPPTLGASVGSCIDSTLSTYYANHPNTNSSQVPFLQVSAFVRCFWSRVLTFVRDPSQFMMPGGTASSSSSVSSSSTSSSVSSTGSGTVSSSSSSLFSSSSSSVSSGSGSSSSSQQSSVSSLANVSIRDLSFSPSSLTVKTGTTVRWANNESFNIPHTVTRDSGTVGPQSGILHPGDSYSYTFTASGTYSYHCQVHPMMKGKVIVTP